MKWCTIKDKKGNWGQGVGPQSSLGDLITLKCIEEQEGAERRWWCKPLITVITEAEPGGSL